MCVAVSLTPAVLYLGHASRLLCKFFSESSSAGCDELSLRCRDRNGHSPDCHGRFDHPTTLDDAAHAHLCHRRRARRATPSAYARTTRQWDDRSRGRLRAWYLLRNGEVAV